MCNRSNSKHVLLSGAIQPGSKGDTGQTGNINLTEEVRPLYTKNNTSSNYINKDKVDGVGAHSFDFQHPEVIENGVENGTIPTIGTQ